MLDFVSTRFSESTIVIQVSGKLNEMSRKYFFDCVSDYIDSGYKHVIIECHKLGYLDSSGLAALLRARKRAAKNGGRVYLTRLNSNIAELLEVTKLGQILSVFPTTKDAVLGIENRLACDG